MMKKEERDITLRFRVTEEEKALIEEKMKLCGTINMSAYLRKQAVDGYVIKLDFPEIRKFIKTVSLYCDRANNIARRVNEPASLYDTDLSEITAMTAEVRDLLRTMVEKIIRIE